ncbi:hypothetical protein EJ07DRAFT_128601, partial [Lizonia empirigonia]
MYKGIKTRTYHDVLYDDQYANQDFDPTETPLVPGKLQTAIIDWMEQIEDNGQYDVVLFHEWQALCQEWTLETFNAIDSRLRKALKEMLKHGGIHIATKTRDTIAQQLYALAQPNATLPVWPADELEAMGLDPNFKSRQLKTMNRDRPTSPKPQTGGAPSGVMALTNLAKIYSENEKFTGDKYDVLSNKIVIFKEHCAKVGITHDKYATAISIMLSGKASAYYYTSIASQNLSFEGIVAKLSAYFHTTENHQMFLNEWRTIMLKKVIADNPDKTLPQCLEEVIEKLHKVYLAMAQHNGQNETSLANQLLSACQGVKACTPVLMKPATSFAAVAADLRTAVGIWSRCEENEDRPTQFTYEKPWPANEGDKNDVFYTNRRYNQNETSRDGPRYGSPRFNNSPRPPGRYPPRPQHDKKCFVCGKRGCWSTRHTLDERKESRRRYRTYVQSHGVEDDYTAFLVDFEGIDIGDEEGEQDGDLDAYFNTHDYFNTSMCGTVDGQALAIDLNNAAVKHAITKVDPYATTEDAPHLFTLDHRYGADQFQGIMPDTGAAGVSTAGRTQVAALQRKQPEVKIDESTAGRHRIRFGDNPECASLGDVTVATPFGPIKFAVMPTNTPFLLCLADMDHHGIYLNNIDNVLVHEGKEYPVIRKWGHPWLLLGDSQETAAYHLTEAELTQLHRRFGHPAAARLHRILSEAGHEDIPKITIENINKFCHQCQIVGGRRPGRFKFTLRDKDLDFNSRLIVDVMNLDKRPVLHAVDEATGFQAARFIPDMRASTTWDTLRAM